MLSRQRLHVLCHPMPIFDRRALGITVDRLHLAIVGGCVKLTAQHRPRDGAHIRPSKWRNPMGEEAFRCVRVL